MGVVFEENDPSTGGVFVASMAVDGAARQEGLLTAGDQLVAVNGECVLGLNFDNSLAKILESQNPKTELTIFRGGVTNLYGNLGPSEEWLSEFLLKMSPVSSSAPHTTPVQEVAAEEAAATKGS